MQPLQKVFGSKPRKCLLALGTVLSFLCAAMSMKVAKRHLKDTARMDGDNKALCYALRNPPGGARPFPLHEIQKLVPLSAECRSRYQELPCGCDGWGCPDMEIRFPIIL